MPKHVAEIAASPGALDANLVNAPLQVDASGRMWVRQGIIEAPVATTGTSAANTAQTVSTPSAGPRKILYVLATYDGTATQTGVTVTINSVEGAAFDTVIFTGTADAEDTYFEPSTELILQNGDTLDVTAPAGGVGVASSILIASQV